MSSHLFSNNVYKSQSSSFIEDYSQMSKFETPLQVIRILLLPKWYFFKLKDIIFQTSVWYYSQVSRVVPEHQEDLCV